ncbi:MAG TPA: di-heme-cytochrome C peroxidase, partial [Vicinamibacterales bacterium]|nr:di-heme-cytochrome C peroxidase [Vicinamibacterales bacterium]
RALSFSIEVPPGTLPGGQTRLDYSLNGKSTFPMDDAHAFACFMRVFAASGPIGKFRAMWSMSLRDQWIFLRTAFLAFGQQIGPIRPYQTLRYWSTVPFLHGQADAVKYTLMPSAANPSRPPGDGHDCLQAELIRHLNEDAEMSTWDFGFQFLDVDRMTHRGRRRAASFWIEKATAEWKEAQAPFHMVGRLTLAPRSQMSPEECAAQHIDVTANATPDSRPIGSINRARWHAEAASRKARLAGPIDIPAPVPIRRSWVSHLLRAAVLLLVLAVAANLVMGALYHRWAAASVPPAEHVDTVRYLNQGWGTAMDAPSRQLFDYTPQGTSLQEMRYSWFVHLERPFSSARFAAPSHMRQLDFVVDPVPTRANPDQLPVGFARRYDSDVHDDVVDLTCAACHTGQLNVTRDGRTTAIRIDGGQGMEAITDMTAGSFQADLGAAMATTLFNPIKFNRFAHAVLGRDASWSNRFTLWRQMLSVSGRLLAVVRGSSNPHWYPTQEGYGRTDALGRISNVVFGDHLDPANYHTADAPVSFPYLWNIWKFNWVQYNASVSQPMARNVGEAMGTGATFHLVDDYGRPIPAADRYRTSIDFENLQRIESTLQTLQPPRWPEDLLGPIDRAKAARGKVLFDQYCVGCHGPHVASAALTHAESPLRGPGDPLWVIRLKTLGDVGTDPTEALNFIRDRVDLTRTGLQSDEVKQLLRRGYEEEKAREANLVPALEDELARLKKAGAPEETIDETTTELQEAKSNYGAPDAAIAALDRLDVRSVALGEGLTILGQLARERYYTDHNFSQQAQACFDGFDTLDLPRALEGYKPRPLGGVWATPPFLHNGSVPTLYDLLSPVSERPKRFYVGTREFDPKKVGYVTTPPTKGAGGFWFDTTKPGNSNAGHEFRKGYVPYDENKPPEAQYQGGAIGPYLTPAQRYDLIEYLKIRADDEPAPPVPHVPPDCFALLKPAAASSGTPK